MATLSRSPTPDRAISRCRRCVAAINFDVTAARRSRCDRPTLACVHGDIDTQTQNQNRFHIHL